ncbi:MAG TPA: hypothetical protein GXZ23_07450 [Clostridiales bacterium]|nr:hypothetical protein [Clostridiales bacterium]
MKVTIAYRILALLLSLWATWGIGVTTPPSTEDPIVLDKTSELNFILWADPQIANYKLARAQNTDLACQDVVNSGNYYDAVVVAGDITENGLQAEYTCVGTYLQNIDTGVYLMATGNHDIRLRAYSQASKRFIRFSNDLNEAGKAGLVIEQFNYSYEINGYKFIVMGSDKRRFEEAWFSDETLAWLDKEIASVDGKPVFVINHQSLKDTHGLPDTWGSSDNVRGSVGDQSDILFDIMNKYENVMFVTGHLHTAFGDNLYEKKENVHLVNVPSLGIVCKDGFYNEAGTGFVVSVFDDKVIFKARDFAKGVYVPDGDIVIKF